MANATDLASAVGVPRATVNAVFDQILRLLQSGEVVKVNGFGRFEKRLHKGRVLQTPAVQNGEPITYPDCYGVRFRQSPAAKARVNAAAKKTPAAAKKAAKKATKKAGTKGAKK